ncbi:MAG TPA: cache domain-containing protein, partial [Holophagaceae bacterium]
MRRLLLRDLLILAGGMIVLILAASWWEQQMALRQQADARAEESLRHLDRTLRADLEAVQELGETFQSWWSTGALDPGRPEQAARLITPLLASQHAVTSLNLARPDARSLLFLRLGGTWSVRELQPVGAGARVRWMRLDASGRILQAEAWTPMDYDPRTRPWYQTGATASGTLWTEAYPFYTTRDPGITCCLPVRDPQSGLQGVVALDFLLDDLTAEVWSAQPTPNSRCLVLDDRNRVVILPREPEFESSPARRAAFLRPLSP